jgi:hypothetical protein
MFDTINQSIYKEKNYFVSFVIPIYRFEQKFVFINLATALLLTNFEVFQCGQVFAQIQLKTPKTMTTNSTRQVQMPELG